MNIHRKAIILSIPLAVALPVGVMAMGNEPAQWKHDVQPVIVTATPQEQPVSASQPVTAVSEPVTEQSAPVAPAPVTAPVAAPQPSPAPAPVPAPQPAPQPTPALPAEAPTPPVQYYTIFEPNQPKGTQVTFSVAP